MKKKIAAFVLSLCIFCTGVAYAAPPELMITDARVYTAKLYYCDAYRGKIVLTDITPSGEKTDGKTRTAFEAEYTEINICCDGVFSDGIKIPQSEFNKYADSTVRIIITRNASDEMRVVVLKFI